MKLQEEWGRRSKESRWILTILVVLIFYFSNTSPELIVESISNFWFSILASAGLIILWFIITKK